MGEMDSGMKALLQRFAAEFIALVLPGATDLRALPAESPPTPQLAPDAAFFGKLIGEPCIFHFEFQLRGNEAMGRRCFEYGSRLSTEHRLPVFSIVIWPERRRLIPESPYVLRVGPYIAGQWNFINIKLFELEARDMLKTRVPALLSLVPFMHGGANAEVVEQAARIIQSETSGPALSDLECLLALFAARRLGKDFASALLTK